MNQHLISILMVHKANKTIYNIKLLLPEGIHRLRTIVEREARLALQNDLQRKYHGQQSEVNYIVTQITDLGIFKAAPPD